MFCYYVLLYQNNAILSQAFQFLDHFSGNYVALLMSFSTYSGTPLIWSPMGQNNLAVLTGWLYYRGRLKFHDLRAVMTNTPYSEFTFLQQLFSLTNYQTVDITYSSRKKLLKISPQYILKHLKFGFSIATSAPYVYCSLKTVQEQAQSTRSIKLACHRHFNFLNFKQLAILTGWNYKRFYCLGF